MSPDSPAFVWEALGILSHQGALIERWGKYGMRYRDLNEARPWRQYRGRTRTCLLSNARPVGITDRLVVQADAIFGTVLTGRSEVHWGYFVRIVGTDEECLGEDRYSLRLALVQAAAAVANCGWTLEAIGLDDEWTQTGLSENSGYGYHPAFNRRVHMLEAPTAERSSNWNRG